MPIIVSKKEVLKQSKQVYKQFGPKWNLFAKYNSRLPHEKTESLRNSGVGKFLVLAAMGESLVDSIPMLKKHRDKIDIVTCDKGFEVLMKNGIKPDYVFICDCNILYKWVKDSIHLTEGVKLITTLYASPRWVKRWRGPRYFFVNKDSIHTEEIFKPLLPEDDLRVIVAGSNVSNAMLIFFTGSDEHQNINWSGYENYFLVGYDYSWRPNGEYYAFNDPKPKRYYMNHRTMLDFKNQVCFTSENLFFSVKWLYSYITAHKLPVVNCSGRGLLDIDKGNLETILGRIKPRKEVHGFVTKAFEETKKAKKNFDECVKKFEESRRLLYAGV